MFPERAEAKMHDHRYDYSKPGPPLSREDVEIIFEAVTSPPRRPCDELAAFLEDHNRKIARAVSGLPE